MHRKMRRDNHKHVWLLAQCLMPGLNWMLHATYAYQLAAADETDIAMDFLLDHKHHRQYHSWQHIHNTTDDNITYCQD